MSLTLSRAAVRPVVGTAISRAVVVVALLAGAAAGLGMGAAASQVAADGDLTRLLRAMALIKLLFVAAAASAMWWRLQVPVAPGRLTAYAAACVAMAAGPGLIWFLAYLGPASIALHGGVGAAAVMLWRDPAASRLLESALARRRRA